MKLIEKIRHSWRRSKQREETAVLDNFEREREEHERKRVRDPSLQPFDTKNPVP
jgi:2-polyprenyl-6-methoxyphenol hydroxylase-like FAD-dependent oxidoreductase